MDCAVTKRCRGAKIQENRKARCVENSLRHGQASQKKFSEVNAWEAEL